VGVGVVFSPSPQLAVRNASTTIITSKMLIIPLLPDMTYPPFLATSLSKIGGR